MFNDTKLGRGCTPSMEKKSEHSASDGHFICLKNFFIFI